MRVLVYECALASRRLWRRRTQGGLMLATFTISIALSLLGWSLFHTMFLRQPAFDPEGQLYRIGQTGGMAGESIFPATRADMTAWKEQQTVFSEFAPVMLYQSLFVTTEQGVERFLGANVSSEALRMVGAKPLLGRLFVPDEDKIGCTPVVLLSERMWRSRFNADASVIGRSVKVDGTAAIVVGVMPAAFRFPNDQELWQPLGFSPHEKADDHPVHDIIARLKPGVTPGRAAEDLKTITQRLGTATMAARYQLQPIVTPFREYYLHADMKRSALILFALALVFILVSCANAANLAMIDFFGRTAEIASSLALGVPRGAAIRTLAFQLLITAMIAAAISFGLLLIMAPAVHGAMARITTPYWLLFSLQWHHVAMTVALAFVSAGVAILVPLGYVSLVSAEQIIRHSAGATRGTGRGMWRRTLLTGQIALLTVLAVAAGLLLRSSHHVRDDQWGYDARRIFVAKTSTAQADFPTPEVRLATHLRLLDEIERVPGVAASALMTHPVGFSAKPVVFYATTAEGLADGRSQGGAVWSMVTPNIFATFDTPFLEGSTFERDGSASGTPPVVITHSLAQRLWPGTSAVGRPLFARFGVDPRQAPVQGIVRGVVRDFQAAGPKADVNDGIFSPLLGGIATASFLYARGIQAMPTTEAVRAAVQRVDPRMAIYFPNSLQNVINTELSSVHLTTRLTTAYALAAMLLCAVGVYSITVAQVLQRNREFGIRMALGIEARRLWRHFARGQLLTAALGVVLGLIAAAALVHALRALLFGVNERDPITFVAVAAIILLVAALACVPSLFRLQRVNPADCLRSL